jgi:ribosomal protein S18 acetylase RimI-like enzyme
MQIAIRAATARDYDALNEIIGHVDGLHREHLPHIFQEPDGPPRDREYMMAVLADELHGIFIAEAEEPVQKHAEGPVLSAVEGAILGFVQLTIRDAPPIPILVPRRVAVVENLAVREDFRRAGIGRALMRHAQRWAEELRATEIELNVYEFNQAAINFYRNLGYATSSCRMSKRLD